MCHYWILELDENSSIAVFHGIQSETFCLVYKNSEIPLENR